jgi:citrate lyase subunit beta / citryl-CoA lyase
VLPRSYLYVPGDSPQKLAKVLQRGADAVIADLEDAIAPGRKAVARQTVRSWLASLGNGDEAGAEIWVRVNSGASIEADLAGVFSSALTGICVPKVSRPEDLQAVQGLLRELEQNVPLPRPLVLQPLIETAAAVSAAERIARAERVRCMQLGEHDLGAEVGIERSGDDIEFLFARSQLVFGSAAAGIGPPVGPVSVDFNDLERFRASTLTLKRLGFRSRACIHPAQVKVVNEVFTPSIMEVEQARLLVETFDDALERGSGVVRDKQGAMVDEAVVRAARRLLNEST